MTNGRTAIVNNPAKSLFIRSSISGYNAEGEIALSDGNYYDRLINTAIIRTIGSIEGANLVAQQLANIARHAYFAKQMTAVEQAARVMLGLPLSKPMEAVARYYLALSSWKRGDRDGARQSLERVAEEGVSEYRARALQIIGLTYHEAGEFDAALQFYAYAGKAAFDCDRSTVATSLQMTAVIRSINGDHKKALADLEKLFPVFRELGRHYPALYYDYLNSLAVELGENAHFSEADALCSITLASGFADAYPNWAETRAEITEKQRIATPSIVSIRNREVTPSTSSKRNPNHLAAFALVHRSSNRASFQRPILPTTGPRTNFNSASILDRVLSSIGSRAPPPFVT